MSEPPRDPAGDLELEELGDEVIIAQETGAHAPQRRVNVTTDHPTVVISEHPPQRQSAPVPAAYAKRERSEQTVVIRDRKKLDKMRREIEQRRRKPRTSRSTIYLVGVAALASLVTGTLIAALVDASDAPGSAPVMSAEPVLLPPPESEPAPSAVPPGTIDLDALPEPTTPRAEP